MDHLDGLKGLWNVLANTVGEVTDGVCICVISFQVDHGKPVSKIGNVLGDPDKSYTIDVMFK